MRDDRVGIDEFFAEFQSVNKFRKITFQEVTEVYAAQRGDGRTAGANA